MEASNADSTPDLKASRTWRLVGALDQMRDAFTQACQLLRDIQFEQVSELRASAEAASQALCQKFNLNESGPLK